jgi:hypothetical protein
MNRRRFILQLGLITASVLVVLLFLHIFQPFAAFKIISLITLVFFVLMSLSMYLLAAKAAVSKDKNAFTRLIMVFTFVKMLLTVILIILFQKLLKPENTLYLIPFFFIYIVFTVFETMFMTKLGKIKAR